MTTFDVFDDAAPRSLPVAEVPHTPAAWSQLKIEAEYALINQLLSQITPLYGDDLFCDWITRFARPFGRLFALLQKQNPALLASYVAALLNDDPEDDVLVLQEWSAYCDRIIH